MLISTLSTTEDMAWLHDVHGINPDGFVLALLFGNEDSPGRIELFAVDHYRCRPTVYQLDDSGENLVMVRAGDSVELFTQKQIANGWA